VLGHNIIALVFPDRKLRN